VWQAQKTTFYGGLLVLDGRGQPLEFVHNSIVVPTGFLWPEGTVRNAAIAALSQSLCEACRQEPLLLLCDPSVGSPEFCRQELAPMVPCALVRPGEGSLPPECAWVNTPPSDGSSQAALLEELKARHFLLEPFSRVRKGLREAYPEAGMSDAPG
jgi:hypothetical protein